MKLTFALFGLLIGLVLGFYIAVFGIECIISAVLDNFALIRTATFFVVLAVFCVFVWSENIIISVFGVEPRSVADQISEVIVEILKIVPGVPEEAKEQAQILTKTLTATYANWLLRTLIFRTFVVVCVATSGTIATMNS